MVFLFARASQVRVDHLADRRGAVRETHVVDTVALFLQLYNETTALRRFTGTVQALKNNELAAHGVFF